MKYLISFFLIFAGVIFSHAQTDSTKLKQQIYEDVKQVIASIAESLQVGAEHVYTVLIKQQLVSSVTNLTLIVLFVFVTWVCFRSWRAATKQLDKNYEEGIEVLQIVFCILAVCFGLFAVMYLAVTAENMVTGFINPEYGAIKEILDTLKSNQ